MARYQLYATDFQDLDNDLNIPNIYAIDWLSFEFTNGYDLYTVRKEDLQKPYMIAYKKNIFKHWDILFLINGVESILELNAGDILKIPKAEDIETFIKIQKS